MKKILKWIGIILGGLLGLIIIAALGLYIFAPDPVTARSEIEIAASPEVVFAQFTDYDDWYELWDVVELTPPPEPQGAGSTFWFVEPDGTVVNGTITQFEEGRVYAADLAMEGLDAEFSFSLTLEPTANGTQAVLYNEGTVGGPMKVMMAAYHDRRVGRLLRPGHQPAEDKSGRVTKLEFDASFEPYYADQTP